jgi:hypothetical protein
VLIIGKHQQSVQLLVMQNDVYYFLVCFVMFLFSF